MLKDGNHPECVGCITPVSFGELQKAFLSSLANARVLHIQACFGNGCILDDVIEVVDHVQEAQKPFHERSGRWGYSCTMPNYSRNLERREGELFELGREAGVDDEHAPGKLSSVARRTFGAFAGEKVEYRGNG
jgi:hypothetical protein